jgi:hypothetical protein
MKAHYLSDVSETPPSPPSDPQYGYPTNGDRAKGLKPTAVGAYQFYSIAQELENVITDAGETPDLTNLRQVADVIAKLRTSISEAGAKWTISDGATGWMRESDTGFTIQWGSEQLDNSGNVIPDGPDDPDVYIAEFPRTFKKLFYINYQTDWTADNWGLSSTDPDSDYWIHEPEYPGNFWLAIGIS